MIRAGADDWQAERDIYRVVEVEKFERDKALVVVHRQHRVVVAACGIAKDCVGDAWAFELGNAEGVERFDGGSNDPCFLVAELAVFTGVGVEACHGNSRAADASLMKKSGGEFADVDDRIRAEHLRHAREWFVNGCEADGQMFPGEQHAVVGDTKGVGEKFRLAGEGESDRLELVLADRRGDHGSGLAVFEFEGGQFQCFEGGGGGPLIRPARGACAAVANDFKLVFFWNPC